MSITRHSNRPAGGKNQREKKRLRLLCKQLARHLAKGPLSLCEPIAGVLPMDGPKGTVKYMDLVVVDTPFVGSLSADGSTVTLTQRLRELERQNPVVPVVGYKGEAFYSGPMALTKEMVDLLHGEDPT